MSGQTKSHSEVSKRQTKRNKPRLHITLKKAKLEWLRKATPKISKFLDEVIDRLREQTAPHTILILPYSEAGVAESGKGVGFRVPISEVGSSGQLSTAIIDFFEYNKHDKEYAKWIEGRSPSDAKRFQNKLKTLLNDKTVSSPAELRQILEPYIQKRDRHMINAVRSYLNFLEETGKRKRTEIDDFRAVVPSISTKAKSEVEKAISKNEVIKAFNSITGRSNIKKLRKLVFKLLAFSGLREKEVVALLNQFKPEIIDKTFTAFGIPKEYRKKIVAYDMETVKIPERKEKTKRTYIALFPAELLKEIKWFKNSGIKLSIKTIQPGRMFTNEGRIDLKLLRSFNQNWLNDNVFKYYPEAPADAANVIEFIQGRAPKTVGGRNYRANVKTAAKLYYNIVDYFKKDVPIL